MDDLGSTAKILEAQEMVIEKIALGGLIGECLETICYQVEKFAPGCGTSILLMKGSQLVTGAAPSLPKEYCEAIDGVFIGPDVGSCGTAAFLRQEVCVSDIENDSRWKNYKDVALQFGLRACHSTPILSKNKVLGTFAVYYHTVTSPGKTLSLLLPRFSHLAGLAIQKHAIESAKKLAEERERKAMAIRSEFFSNMSHEIRTHLNGVLGLIGLLKDTNLTEEQLEMLKIASSCGTSLLTVLNDVLDLSKIESGELSLEKRSFNVRNCVRDICYLHTMSVKIKDITLTSNIDTCIAPSYLGDVTRIKQILMNYLSNAIKFTPARGQVVLSVYNENKVPQRRDSLDEIVVGRKRIREVEDGEDDNDDVEWITFSVRDNGIGIAKDNQKDIFKAFCQGNDYIVV